MIISYFSPKKKESKNHGHAFLFSQSRKELIILYKCIFIYLFIYLGGKKKKG
jgi:hypothetical protein